ncbi:MAG: CinA family protein [Pseudomonadota bacterium]
MIDAELFDRAQAVLALARAKGLMLATAESCTGGLVGAALTAVPGSSDVVAGGFITYSNEAKMRLGVPQSVLAAHGAVSEETARALAEAAADQLLLDAPAILAVSVTGVAGPGGGTAQKPVGLVHFAVARRGADGQPAQTLAVVRETFGDVGRGSIRSKSVHTALGMLSAQLSP